MGPTSLHTQKGGQDKSYFSTVVVKVFFFFLSLHKILLKINVLSPRHNNIQKTKNRSKTRNKNKKIRKFLEDRLRSRPQPTATSIFQTNRHQKKHCIVSEQKSERCWFCPSGQGPDCPPRARVGALVEGTGRA